MHMAKITALIGLSVCLGLAAAHEPQPPRTDAYGDPLPPGVLARMGWGRMRHPSPLVRLIAFSPDGKSLVSGGFGGLRVWDTETGRLRKQFDIKADWATFTFSGDEIAVASANRDDGIVTAQLFDPVTGKA